MREPANHSPKADQLQENEYRCVLLEGDGGAANVDEAVVVVVLAADGGAGAESYQAN